VVLHISFSRYNYKLQFFDFQWWCGSSFLSCLSK
jgi:hypothetical protein